MEESSYDSLPWASGLISKRSCVKGTLTMKSGLQLLNDLNPIWIVSSETKANVEMKALKNAKWQVKCLDLKKSRTSIAHHPEIFIFEESAALESLNLLKGDILHSLISAPSRFAFS